MVAKNKLVAVNTRALLRRINRALESEGQVLKRPKGKQRDDLGEYYVLSLSGNYVVQKNVDIEAIGRKLGALKPYERLEEDQ